MKTIDFGGTDQPQPPQLDGGGFYTGLTPYQPGPEALQIPQQSSPLTAWPVPGHTQLSERDPKRGQGDGAFGAPRDHGGGSHTGIDITAPEGTPVVAAGDGTVANIQPDPSTSYGNQVVIAHPDGLYTQYGHLSRSDVAPGDTVQAGDQIGLTGRTGDVPQTADAHLHFEVRSGSMRPHSTGGQVVDPMQYLPAAP
jgi:murein DD-endopeptidase MepM/ murein hydrolase activator NlpD